MGRMRRRGICAGSCTGFFDGKDVEVGEGWVLLGVTSVFGCGAVRFAIVKFLTKQQEDLDKPAQRRRLFRGQGDADRLSEVWC